ncbi:hypothetical protein D3C86_1316860 [compost metagenome]
MPSRVARSLLFLSSYCPLFFIFAMQLFQSHKKYAAAFFLIGLISIAGLLFFIRWHSGSSPNQITISSVQTKDSEVMSYIVSYIFPYMGIDFSEIANTLSLAFFFLILMVIYVNANMIHINPTLNFIGFHIFEIEDTSGVKHTLICKKERIHPGDKIKASSIGDSLLMENTQ